MTRNEAHLLKSRSALLLTVFVFACATLVAFAVLAPSRAALADDEPASQDPTTLTAYELQMQIENAQEVYGAALDEVKQINAEIDENQAQIDKLKDEIPAQQERSAKAARELYKIQQEGVGVVDLLLSADSLHDFLVAFEYVNYVTDANVNEMNRLYELKQEIEAAQVELRQKHADANARADAAEAALEDLQAAQAEVQRRIEEEARMAAEIAAQAAALAEEPRSNDAGEAAGTPAGGGAPAGDAGNSGGSEDAGNSGDAGSNEGSSGATETNNAPDLALSGDEAAFVAEWAPRIDAYLAGSPLAGQGSTFARAAYEYEVDPRWSPAISFTESSKGLYCFLPHNAWGWGSVSWDSWEEAIFDHVRGLSRGYGYTISPEAAQKYCPPNWEMWYDRTLSQMNMI